MFENTFKRIDGILRLDAGCTTELDYTEQTSWILFLKYLDDMEDERNEKEKLRGMSYQFIITDQYRWKSWAAPKKTDGSFDHQNALTGEDLIEFVNNNLFPYLKGFRERASRTDSIEYKIGAIFDEIKNKFQSGYPLRDVLEQMDQLRFRTQIEKNEMSVLGLGGHHLQSLSTFHRVVKKLSHFYYFLHFTWKSYKKQFKCSKLKTGEVK